MISPELLARVACPLCLEAQGCEKCTRAGGHASCEREYAPRAACACGGPDKVALREQGDALVCPCCARSYPVAREQGYVDLLAPAGGETETLYDDHEFQERLRVSAAPPLLSARVKADMMRHMLRLEPGQPVLDLGCGAGKMALFAHGHGAHASGVDAAPFFLPAAAAAVDLVRGDLRRLPFRKGAFAAAWSIDVLEHLDEPGVAELLVEARRVLAPGGALFVYTHAMESSRLASFQRGVNRLARRLGRAGLIDHEREAMRKADHRNPLRSHEHFDACCAAAGLRVRERRYYNVVFKAVVEDLGLRMVEQWRRRRSSTDGNEHGHEHVHGGQRATDGDGHGQRAAEMPGRFAMAVGHVLTWILKLDVVLFGGIRTGPFFARVEPVARPEAR
jgi:SAM-dependent methyltransferase